MGVGLQTHSDPDADVLVELLWEGDDAADGLDRCPLQILSHSIQGKLLVVVNGGCHKVILSDRTRKEEFIIDVNGDTDYRVSVGAIKGFKLEEIS